MIRKKGTLQRNTNYKRGRRGRCRPRKDLVSGTTPLYRGGGFKSISVKGVEGKFRSKPPVKSPWQVEKSEGGKSAAIRSLGEWETVAGVFG